MPSFEHPLQLFRLEYPEGWQAQYREDGQMFLLAAPPGTPPGVLSVAPLALKQSAEFTPEELGAELMETARRAGLNAPPSDIRLRGRGTAVSASLEGPSPQQLPGTQGSLLRLWLIRQGALPLILTHMGPGTTHLGQCNAVDAIVESVEFPEILPPTPSEFAQRVMEVVEREYPHLRIAPATSEEAISGGAAVAAIRLEDSRSGQSADLGLENLYRSALLTPESAGALIRDHLDRVSGGLFAPERELSFAGVRSRILPMLKPVDWASSAPDGVRMLTVPFALELQVCFVVDEPEVVLFVTDDLLNDWGVPKEQIEGLALDNLAKRPIDPGLLGIPGGEGQPVALIVSAQDGFAAARFTLPDIRQQLADLLGDEYLVGVPNRDFFIAFQERAPQAEALIRQVKADFHRMDHPLSPIIYRVHPDRIEATTL